MSLEPSSPDLRDSVPPLSATGATAPSRPSRRGRTATRVFVGVALALGLAGAFEARASRASPPVHATEVLDASPPPAPAPAPTEDEDDEDPPTLDLQRARLFATMQRELGLDARAMAGVEAVFAASPVLGQGNPAISRHPMTRAECRRIRSEAHLETAHVAACRAPDMVPLYDVEAGQTEADARVCIDQFEFPDIPCEYPVVNVRAREAELLCEAVGKRLCDAHEWEGACAGSLRAPEREYRFGWPRGDATYAHNVLREKIWAYGPAKDHALCATGSFVTPGCNGGGWATCGSNTYPTGAFPACVSRFGVFDLHGNAAEHMNLPLNADQLGSRGGEGFTEMKGSWFAFATADVHADDCRWRAPAWHETRVMSEASHRNYHLGFRCCKDVGGR